MSAILRFAFLAGVVLAGAAACGASERAAARDPMKCERDPSCAKARGSYPDCSKQCADDPDCVDRCRQINAGIDKAP